MNLWLKIDRWKMYLPERWFENLAIGIKFAEATAKVNLERYWLTEKPEGATEFNTPQELMQAIRKTMECE